MSRLTRVWAALAIATLAFSAHAPRVAAECLDGYPSSDANDYRSFVFTATVIATSADPTQDPPADSSAYQYEAILDVGRVFRGELPDPLTINGWSAGCSRLLIPAVGVGESLFIALGGADPVVNHTLYGEIAVWRETDGGWEFYEAALAYGSDSRYYPDAARRATTIDAILALVAAPPNTSTLGPVPSGSVTDRSSTLILAFLIAAVVTSRVLSGRARAPNARKRPDGSPAR